MGLILHFERIVSIGDGYWDLVAARLLGLDFIGIGSGQAAERLKAAGARNVFPNLLASGITTGSLDTAL
jgi:phosphoglycolate phosphatase-like HAD superfamily hydrolase